MFDYQVVTPVQIFNGIKEMNTSQEPYALTAVMLFAAISFYLLGKLVFGGRAYAMYSKASVQATLENGWKFELDLRSLPWGRNRWSQIQQEDECL